MPAIRHREAARGDRGSPYRRMDTDLMVLEDTWSPSKFGTSREEDRTQEAATEQFFNPHTHSIRNTNSKDSSHPALFLSHDGHNSPEDEQFPPHAGFRRVQTDSSRPSGPAGPFRRHYQQERPSTVQTQAQQDVSGELEGPLTEGEQNAQLLLAGPPPGMPAHLLSPEDRKMLEQRQAQQVSSVVNGLKKAVRWPVTSHPSASFAPKEKQQTKDRLHQLSQPSVVGKARTTAAPQANGPANATFSGFTLVNTDQASSNNGYLPNGQRRLPPARLSAKNFHLIRSYALHHNGGVPFRPNLGLPVYGLVRLIAAGHLEVRADWRSWNPATGHGPLLNTSQQMQALSFQHQHAQHASLGNLLALTPHPPAVANASNQPFLVDDEDDEDDDNDDDDGDFGDSYQDLQNVEDPFGLPQVFTSRLPPSSSQGPFSSAPQSFSQPAYQAIRRPTIPSPTPPSKIHPAGSGMTARKQYPANYSTPGSGNGSHVQHKQWQQQAPLSRPQQQYSSQPPMSAYSASLPSHSQPRAGSSSRYALVVPHDDDENEMAPGFDFADVRSNTALSAALKKGNGNGNANGNATKKTTANANANTKVNANAGKNSLGEPVYANKNGALLGHFLNGKFVRLGAAAVKDGPIVSKSTAATIAAPRTITPAAATGTTNTAPPPFPLSAATIPAADPFPPFVPAPPAIPPLPELPTSNDEFGFPEFSMEDFVDFSAGGDGDEDKENEHTGNRNAHALHPVFENATSEPPAAAAAAAPATVAAGEDQVQSQSHSQSQRQTLDDCLLTQPANVTGLNLSFMLSHWNMDESRKAMMRAGWKERVFDEDEDEDDDGDGGDGGYGEGEETGDGGKENREGNSVGAGAGGSGETENGEIEGSYDEQTAQWLQRTEGGEEQGEKDDDLF